MALTNRFAGALASISAMMMAGVASAQAIGDLEIVGAPDAGGIGFQPAAT